MTLGACAGCGATGAVEVSRQPWFGGAIITYACTHCGQQRRFLVRMHQRETHVRCGWPVHPDPCPFCDSEGLVASTHTDQDPPFRWRRCRVCGHRWKEVAEPLIPPGSPTT